MMFSTRLFTVLLATAATAGRLRSPVNIADFFAVDRAASDAAVKGPCDGVVTEDDAADCAQRTIEEILARQQQAAAADTTKAEHCAEEAERLQENIEDAHTALKSKEAAYESARYAEAQCGCCCDEYWTIRSRKLSIAQDVDYQRNRIENLEDQVEHLNAWCSV
jgi:polyhydroxyalkanoate synthesis regulator phasin